MSLYYYCSYRTSLCWLQPVSWRLRGAYYFMKYKVSFDHILKAPNYNLFTFLMTQIYRSKKNLDRWIIASKSQVLLSWQLVGLILEDWGSEWDWYLSGGRQGSVDRNNACFLCCLCITRHVWRLQWSIYQTEGTGDEVERLSLAHSLTVFLWWWEQSFDLLHDI